jgi:hypothetical protein
MSDMKTFTVRDLDRAPAKVLAAAKRDGVACVRQRNGEMFAVRPLPPPGQGPPDWKGFVRQHREWLRRTYPVPSVWPKQQVEELDRLIASDGRVL